MEREIAFEYAMLGLACVTAALVVKLLFALVHEWRRKRKRRAALPVMGRKQRD